MAAKIFAFFVLLALSASAATAYCPRAIPIEASHPGVQLQALASSILAPSAVLFQQPLAILQQQCQAHLAVQSITALQQQQQQLLLNPIATLLPNVFNQLALANPITAAFQQQQLLPHVFNQLALASPVAQWQQQQLVSSVFNQASLVNPIIAPYLQQQQFLPNVFNQLALASPVANWQQQQLVSNMFNQVALASPNLQQPFILGAIF